MRWSLWADFAVQIHTQEILGVSVAASLKGAERTALAEKFKAICYNGKPFLTNKATAAGDEADLSSVLVKGAGLTAPKSRVIYLFPSSNRMRCTRLSAIRFQFQKEAKG